MSGSEEDASEDSSMDKTVLFGAQNMAKLKAKAMRAKLICLDLSQLEDVDGPLEINLVEGEKSIGRTKENDVCLEASGISKKHATISAQGGDWVLKDLDSANGTWVNDIKIAEARLKNGDTVKFGKVPFEFVLARPDVPLGGSAPAPALKPAAEKEAFNPDATLSEKTMFVSSNIGASALLLDAAAREQKAKQSAAAPAAAPKKAAIASAEDLKPKKKFPFSVKQIAIGLVAILTLGGGIGGYLVWHGKQVAEAETIKNLTSDLRKFRHDAEETNNVYSPPLYTQQITFLNNISAQISEMMAKSNAPALRFLKAQAIFMGYERDLTHLVKQAKFADAEALHKRVSAEFATVSEGLDQQAGEIADDVKLIKDLFTLAETVIALNQFAGNYPDPNAAGAKRPPADLMTQILGQRQLFAEQKRANNMALSVRYPYFNGLVGSTDSGASLVVDRWNSAMKSGGAVDPAPAAPAPEAAAAADPAMGTPPAAAPPSASDPAAAAPAPAPAATAPAAAAPPAPAAAPPAGG